MGLNKVSKLASVSHFHAGLLPNDWEGTSKIALHFPSMWVNWQARWILSCRARAWTRCLATRDRLEARHVTHPIEGELSLNSVILFLGGIRTPLPLLTKVVVAPPFPNLNL